MSTHTPITTVDTTEGRTFAVRYLPVGARYGPTHTASVHEAPLVEFLDASLADDGPHGPIGEFVSRYHAATPLGTDGYRFRVGATGPALDDGTPARRLDENALARVRVWIMTTRNHLTPP